MKVALVTGAASGIGRATALELNARGWRVYATDVDEEALDRLPKVLRTFPLDVTSDEDCSEAVERIVEEAGSLDLLVNNAGDPLYGAMEDLEPEMVRRQFDVNFHGQHRLAREVLPVMREQGRGTIVNVSSVLGKLSLPGVGSYSASKHAVEAFSDALRMEVAEFGVDVVLVEPAGVSTEFVDDSVDDHLDGDSVYSDLHGKVKRYGDRLLKEPLAVTPEDVAEVIADAAESADSDARVRVGRGAPLWTAAGALPTKVTDTVNRAFMRL